MRRKPQAYTPEQSRDDLLERLDKDPPDAVGWFCHEGLEYDVEQPYSWVPAVHVAYLCSMEGRGATREAALADLVSKVRAAVSDGWLGC